MIKAVGFETTPTNSYSQNLLKAFDPKLKFWVPIYKQQTGSLSKPNFERLPVATVKKVLKICRFLACKRRKVSYKKSYYPGFIRSLQRIIFQVFHPNQGCFLRGSCDSWDRGENRPENSAGTRWSRYGRGDDTVVCRWHSERMTSHASISCFDS